MHLAAVTSTTVMCRTINFDMMRALSRNALNWVYILMDVVRLNEFYAIIQL
jgi:hypothetical protein